MDASLYYTDITPDVDLLLQNVTFIVNNPRSNDSATNAGPTFAPTPSSSAENKKMVTFEGDEVFALYNINMSVQKVRIHVITRFLSCRTNIPLHTGTIDRYHGQDRKRKDSTPGRYLGRNYENYRSYSGQR